MQINEKNRQIWLDLFRAAEVFRNLKPWDWLYDSDLFGVQDPATGKIGYCCVLGNLGEQFALNVYMGPEGLSSYYEMLDFGEDDPMMAGLRQNCLVVSFEDREYLSDPDRKLIKDLGLKFRGAGQWIMAREYAPGWFPWYINEEQAVFLTHALQQAVAVAIRAEENPELLQFDEEKVLVRVPQPTAEGIHWDEQIQDMPDINLSLALKPDAVLMKQAKKLPRVEGAVLLSLIYAPSPAREDRKSRPFFPVIGLLLEKSSGLIMAYEMFRPNDLETNLQRWFVSVLENEVKARPAQIIVPNWFAADLLDHIAEELEIEIILDTEEPAFQEVMETMFRFM